MVEGEKLSIHTAAGMFSFSPSQSTRWRKMEDMLSNFTSKEAKTMNAGPKSKLSQEGFENQLLQWLFEE